MELFDSASVGLAQGAICWLGFALHQPFQRRDDWSKSVRNSVRSLELHPCFLTLPRTRVRIRIKNVGVLDVLRPDSETSVTELQLYDMLHVAKVLICLATRAVVKDAEIPHALQVIARNYSIAFVEVLEMLLSELESPSKILEQALPFVMNELEALYGYDDALETELFREMNNGRLLRLMAKLNFVNEKPELSRRRECM